MSHARRTALLVVLALLGIVLAAAITWGTSQLVRQHIGLSSEPLTAGRSLLPPPRTRSRTTSTRTTTPSTGTSTTPAPTTPSATAPTQTQPSETTTAPAEAPGQGEAAGGGERPGGEGGDSRSHGDD